MIVLSSSPLKAISFIAITATPTPIRRVMWQTSSRMWPRFGGNVKATHNDDQDSPPHYLQQT